MTTGRVTLSLTLLFLKDKTEVLEIIRRHEVPIQAKMAARQHYIQPDQTHSHRRSKVANILFHPTAQVILGYHATIFIVDSPFRLEAFQVARDQMLAFSCSSVSCRVSS